MYRKQRLEDILREEAGIDLGHTFRIRCHVPLEYRIRIQVLEGQRLAELEYHLLGA